MVVGGPGGEQLAGRVRVVCERGEVGQAAVAAGERDGVGVAGHRRTASVDPGPQPEAQVVAQVAQQRPLATLGHGNKNLGADEAWAGTKAGQLAEAGGAGPVRRLALRQVELEKLLPALGLQVDRTAIEHGRRIAPVDRGVVVVDPVRSAPGVRVQIEHRARPTADEQPALG